MEISKMILIFTLGFSSVSYGQVDTAGVGEIGSAWSNASGIQNVNLERKGIALGLSGLSDVSMIQGASAYKAKSLLNLACRNLGGMLNSIALQRPLRACRGVNSSSFKCETLARGTCMITEETKKEHESRLSEARRQNEINAQIKAENLRKKELSREQLVKNLNELHDQNQSAINEWFEVIENDPEQLCRLVENTSTTYAESCKKTFANVKLSKEAISIATGTALGNVTYVDETLKALDGKEFSFYAANICATVGLNNASYVGDCIKASNGKSYTKSELENCEARAQGPTGNSFSGYEATQCLKKSGQKK